MTADGDHSVEGAMSPSTLGQYFRSFLVKLSMIEAQLGQLELGGQLIFYNDLGSDSLSIL
jgi:mitotic spindle assembly checkpoint protein MAD2B